MTGTRARTLTSATESPFSTRYSRSAPATQDSSTSLTEASSALPTALTSGSGSGSAHATRLAIPGMPLNRVGESWRISASRASSEVSAPPCSASATALAGSCQIATPFSIIVAPIFSAVCIAPANGCASSVETSPLPARAWRLGGGGSAGGPFGAASVIDSITCTSAMPSA